MNFKSRTSRICQDLLQIVVEPLLISILFFVKIANKLYFTYFYTNFKNVFMQIADAVYVYSVILICYLVFDFIIGIMNCYTDELRIYCRLLRSIPIGGVYTRHFIPGIFSLFIQNRFCVILFLGFFLHQNFVGFFGSFALTQTKSSKIIFSV